jgi:hypothetical protein
VRVCQGKLCLFLALSLSDFALTWLLLHQGCGAYESNPAAARCLEQFGWSGLMAFKLGACAAFLAPIAVVARKNARTAQRLLLFACSVLLVVVVYSGSLVPDVCARAETLEIVQARSQGLEEKKSQIFAYYDTLHNLTDQLLAEQCTLLDAVDVLMKSRSVHEFCWQNGMSAKYGTEYSLHQLVAIRLIEEIKESPNISPAVRQQGVCFLMSQFQTAFALPVPRNISLFLSSSKSHADIDSARSL